MSILKRVFRISFGTE